VVNEDREIEHDAALMCGASGRAGGVASVRGVRNPVRLARAVMEHTQHVLLVAAGAEALADREGIERVSPSWHRVAHRDPQLSFGDTIGAVALDGAGDLAAATSTGGIQHKLKGRVGDAPLPGAGLYADDACAVSASGHGEAIMRAVAAHEVAAAVRHGRPLADAVRATLARIEGAAGLIAVGADAEPAIEFNTEVFHRATAGADGIRTAVTSDWL
jgi:beta-aspartyl-peptidase (threonine type)